MNPHKAHSASPKSLARALWQNRELLRQMTLREVTGRYKGSNIGLAWAIIHPLLMLAVYTFVFSVVFEAKWGQPSVNDSQINFALILFTGLILHSLLAEVLNQAPSTLMANPNLVKKVVFPLEILPVVTVSTALFHALASLGVLIIATAFTKGNLPLTALLLPLSLIPLILVSLGTGWLLSATGVYLRDVNQITGFLSTILLFTSPTFFPLDAVPEAFRTIIWLNPLTLPIEEARSMLFFTRQINWDSLALYTAGASIYASVGFFWFQSTRKGFADVM